MRIDCRWIALLLLAACAGMRDPETGSNDSGSSGLLTITASADEVTVGDSPVTLTAAPGEASWSLLGPGKLSGVTGQTTQYLPPDSLDLTESVTVTASRGSDKARAVLKVHPRLSYPVGRRPVAIGFDGARLWVAGAWDLDVLILRPSDAAPLGRVVVNHGVGALVFDGTNMWTINPGADSVTKLRAADGANLGTFPVGNQPIAAAFDGTNLWVTNRADRTVTTLRASDGAILGTFPVPGGPAGIAFDGKNLWVANHDRPPPGGAGEAVTCVRPSDGANLGNVHGGPAPWFVIADGSELWVTSLYAGLVTQLDTTSGGLLQTGRIGNGANVQGMTVARGSLWFGLVPGSVVKVNPANLSQQASFTIKGPSAFAFDGTRLWIGSLDGNSLTPL